MSTAVYAFSGDPITFGHIDIIQRAAEAFEQVIVAIGVNPDKAYTFTLEERFSMANRVLKGLPNVEVMSFKGMLVDFAYESGASFIVKGVRNSSDWNYENILHQTGESQKLGIDTLIFIARPELAHVSSSTVKAIQKEQGQVQGFVPLYIKQCLERRLSKQVILSVTGEIGSGKSHISRMLTEIGKKRKIPVHHIEFDFIGHQITNQLQEIQYQTVRKTICRLFGDDVLQDDGFINRKALGEIVFNDSDALAALNGIMAQPMAVRLRREMYGKTGLILVNAALIAESGMSHIGNNNVLLIHTDKETQQKRMRLRDLDPEQIERRLASQYSYEEKKSILEKQIEKDQQGKLWFFENSEANEAEVGELFDILVNDLDLGEFSGRE